MCIIAEVYLDRIISHTEVMHYHNRSAVEIDEDELLYGDTSLQSESIKGEESMEEDLSMLVDIFYRCIPIIDG